METEKVRVYRHGGDGVWLDLPTEQLYLWGRSDEPVRYLELGDETFVRLLTRYRGHHQFWLFS